MPAAVEVFEDGAAFASLREPAWHRLGEVFTEPVDTRTMLRKARLNAWDIRLAPVALSGRSHRSWFEVIRTNPSDKQPDVLGLVGERYNVFQNEELFAFADNILDGGGRWETAGSIKNGTTVFGTLSIDHDVVIDPSGVNDTIKSYLLVHTSHDGSLAVQATVTPIRVVCQNTLSMALKDANLTYKRRHTQSVKGKIEQARAALNLGHSYMDALSVEANALYQTQVTDKVFMDIVNALYPKPEKDAKGSFTKWENKVDTINSIYRGPTNNMIAGTAWGALNALTERLDWFRGGRGDNAAENVAAAASGFDAVTNAEKSKMLTVVKTLAGVK